MTPPRSSSTRRPRARAAGSQGSQELLRLLLHSGIDVMTQMPLAAEWLRRLVPSFSLSMIRVDAECAPREHYSEYFDEFSHRLFAEQGHLFSARTDDPAAFGNLLRQPVPFGNLIHAPESYLRGATYQHLFSRNGIHHVLDVALRDAEGPLAILGIFREREAPAFTRSDLLTIQQLYPSLVHALRAEPLPAHFDETDSALVVVDEQGRVEGATPNARAWLEDASAGLERARLSSDLVLPEACRHLTRQLVAGEAPTLSLPLAGGRLRLRAYWLNALEGGRRQVAVHLRLEMHRTLKVLRALEAQPLTPQQRRIALGQVNGLTPQQIAGQLGLTAHTLKSYQKDLYARLAVSSAGELTELLARQASGVTFDLNRHQPRRVHTTIDKTPHPGG